MAETRRKFDQDFRDGAVRIVQETGKPIAQVARDLDIHEGTLGNWVAKAREVTRPANGQLSISEREELLRLRKEVAELASAPPRSPGHSIEHVSDPAGSRLCPAPVDASRIRVR